MGTVHAHEGKTHHLARGKADLAGVMGAVKLQGCKTSATNKCLRASGMREGNCLRGEVGAAIRALPGKEAALTHPNTHPGAVGGQDI